MSSSSSSESNTTKNKIIVTVLEDDVDLRTVPNDTEAAIVYIKNLLIKKCDSNFVPVILVHQLFAVVNDRTAIDRQIRNLECSKKVVFFHMNDAENSTVVAYYEDFKNHVLNQPGLNSPIYKTYFEKVIKENENVGISKDDLSRKYRYTEHDIRSLVSSGLLILQCSGYYSFSFPFAGTFMKYIKKGRSTLMTSIKRRQFNEILETELVKSFSKKSSLYFDVQYHLLDLIGGDFVDCVDSTSGRILRIRDD